MVQRCQPSQLDELVEIMLEVRMNLSPTTRFSRDEVYPTVYVQDRYSRLNAEHIEQVLDGRDSREHVEGHAHESISHEVPVQRAGNA